MKKRTRQPGIAPEQEQDWLKRSDTGESAVQIADRDDKDPRTVRTHIEHARQLRELSEARGVVLREALERHYADMCAVADQLNPRSGMNQRVFSPKDDLIKIALRQHLPRSPIWDNLRKLDVLNKKIEDIGSTLDGKVDSLRSDPRLQPFGKRIPAIMSGVVPLFHHQAVQWAQDYPGLDLDSAEMLERTNNPGTFIYGIGFARMGEMTNAELTLIRTLMKDWQTQIKLWPEFLDLEKGFVDRKRLEKSLANDLWAITLRRVLPGRCEYCPI